MTPDDLVAIEEIRQLKYRYVRFLDTKRWDDLAELLTPDVTVSFGGGAVERSGRDEVMAFLVESLGDTSTFTRHTVGQPEIALVDADAATKTWALLDEVVMTEGGLTVRGAGYYDDRYVRAADGWRIAHTGYRRLYEEIEPRREEVRLTASWWATDGRSSLG